MPHARDICLNKKCRAAWEDHKAGRGCKKFEFVAPSARQDNDIMVSATFASESSARIYAAIAWRHGDFSCNCQGWRTQRTCWHVEDMKHNPQKYKGNKKTTKVVSQKETTDILSSMKDKLAAAKSNPAMYAQIKTEISFFQVALGAAADAADIEINSAVDKAKADMSAKEPKTVKPVVVADASDPFAE